MNPYQIRVSEGSGHNGANWLVVIGRKGQPGQILDKAESEVEALASAARIRADIVTSTERR